MNACPAPSIFKRLFKVSRSVKKDHHISYKAVYISARPSVIVFYQNSYVNAFDQISEVSVSRDTKVVKFLKYFS